MAVTALAGAGAYPLILRWPVLLRAIAIGAGSLIFISLALGIGEVYQYPRGLARAFWYFGDDVTTWLAPLFLWAILKRDMPITVALAIGIVFSGTKISILVMLVAYGALLVLLRSRAREISARLWGALAVAALAFVLVQTASPHLVRVANDVAASIAGPGAAATGEGASSATATWEAPFGRRTGGRSGECAILDCLAAHLVPPLRDRLLSAAGGLWMTMQGGFPGKQFPNTGEKFADLMVDADPFGINERFGVSRHDWLRVGQVQNAYLSIGAGYGPLLLALLLAGVGVVCTLAIINIRRGERGSMLAFTLFFVVNAVVNQSQPWLHPGSILLAMGLCGTHILVTFWQTRRFLETRRAKSSVDSNLPPAGKV